MIMVLNGGFGTGTFDNWSVLGNADVVDGSALLNTDLGVPDSVIESFLNLAPATLDFITSPFNATTGSAIESSVFQVTAGKILSFDWEFTSNEGTGSFFNDFSFFSIDSLSDTASANAFLLADTNGPTGSQTSTFNFEADGYYQLGFGVVNQGDDVVNSQLQLLLDNIHILNTGFETGDFSDWNVFGNANVQETYNDPFLTGGIDIFPTEGIYQAVVTNSTGALTDADIEANLGLSAGVLDSIYNGNATEGSAIELAPIDVEAGDTLSFDWDFLTGEVPGSIFNDFAFVSIVDELGNTLYLDTLESVALGAELGYETFNYTFNTLGTVTVSLGVMDVTDTVVDSTLLVDNLLLV